ncbi:hypothetical protein [Pantoea coffeiphila]|uniref:hypothetical protein n=1 Tax=Pantoea coffeiphila TaxID=1465635 RepID=UPI001C0E9DD7|nr:hypothetical protein [Pantoea coffeiphila]
MSVYDDGVVGSPNSPVAHPDGLKCYGRVPEMNSHGDIISAGDIFLRAGRHTGPNRGFGVRHIWAEHKTELVKLGYVTVGDVARFVRDVIRPGSPIYCEFNHPGGKHRPTVLKSSLGIAILEPREASETDSGWIYVVVTAYTSRKAHGVLIGRLE